MGAEDIVFGLSTTLKYTFLRLVFKRGRMADLAISPFPN